MNRKHLFTIFCGIAFTCLFTLSCKKSGSDDSNTSGYYLSATVNGQDWSANVKSTLQNAPAIGVITSSGSTSIFLLLGVKAVGKDTSGIAIVFPPGIPLNQSLAFDANVYRVAAYLNETASGSGAYHDYGAAPSQGGSGTITVTTIDQTNKIVEGSFSGSFASNEGLPAVKITNGKFRCPYTTDATQVPKTGVKF